MVLKKSVAVCMFLVLVFSLMACNPAKENEMNGQLMQGTYISDDGSAIVELCGKNLFSISIVNINFLSTGNYSIDHNKLMLKYPDNQELVFEMKYEQIIFIGANIEGVFKEQGPIGIGTVFQKAFMEVTTDEMIELNTWFFTSGIPNNAIVFKHTDENAKFECVVDHGQFGFGENGIKSTTVKAGDTICWSSIADIEQAFISVIVKIDENIVGYAVIKIIQNRGPADYTANILKEVSIPKICDE